MTEFEANELRENTTNTAKILAILTGNGGGDGGIQGDVKWLMANIVGKEQCAAIRKACHELHAAGPTARAKVFSAIKDVIIVILAVVTILFGSGVLR